MKQKRRVVITGIGLLCPLGDSRRALHEGACDAAPGPSAGPLPPDAPDAHLAGRNIYPLDRPARLLAAAARLALDDAGWSPEALARQDVGLFVGTVFSVAHTIARFDRQAVSEGPAYASPFDFANTVLNAPAGQATIWHGLRGECQTVATGTSSGLEAIGRAAAAVRDGRADCVLAGGFEELSDEVLRALRETGLLREGDRSVGGLAPAEAAALLVLEEASAAARRGARVLAEVVGHGQSFDPSRRGNERRSVQSIGRAMGAALDQARLSAAAVDLVGASAGGLATIDRHETLALAEIFGGRTDAPMVSAVKARIGEPLGAAGPLQCAALIEAMRRGVVSSVVQLGTSPFAGTVTDDAATHAAPAPAPRRADGARACLINSLGLDGHSCSLVLSSVAV